MTSYHVSAALACLALLGWLAGAAHLAPRHNKPPETVLQPAKATAGRFAVQDGGKTVLDRISGLRWQQGSSAASMDHATAKTWCSTNQPTLPGIGWRLPTVGELVALVASKTQDPAVDVAFAGTPKAPFWSSSPWAAGGSAWFVRFDVGYSYHAASSLSFSVRCVR